MDKDKVIGKNLTQAEYMALVPDLIKKLNRIEKHQRQQTEQLLVVMQVLEKLPAAVAKEVNRRDGEEDVISIADSSEGDSIMSEVKTDAQIKEADRVIKVAKMKKARAKAKAWADATLPKCNYD
jgi:hypothetical protein